MTDVQTRRRFVLEHPAYSNMLKTANLIDQAASVDEVPQKVIMLLDNARVHARTAIDVLLETDPLKQEMGKLCVMLLESAEYKIDKNKKTGQLEEVVEITDEYIFTYAMRELKSLPSKFAPRRRKVK